ncbi:hypothetical protein GM661_01185 [Iocasia frigidifontis]|uniref:Uncharacterized protein n=1 Tax=Iocasia fonsfrigidae TaxID=2682810 RepID=A0A8A7K4N7_9FIRM|nr:hypothetical protein [Iocasia fonsfrigidae]QTL96683.1 hypothetical protein GM661_01185 [Iocasia fonsfrigidae]
MNGLNAVLLGLHKLIFYRDKENGQVFNEIPAVMENIAVVSQETAGNAEEVTVFSEEQIELN